MDKLNAAVAALTTDLFYASPEAFCHIVASLHGQGLDLEWFDPPTAEEAALAVVEIGLLDWADEQRDRRRFSVEMRKFIGHVLAKERILMAPPALTMAIMPDEVEHLITQDDQDLQRAVLAGSAAARDLNAIADGLERLPALAELLAQAARGPLAPLAQCDYVVDLGNGRSKVHMMWDFYLTITKTRGGGEDYYLVSIAQLLSAFNMMKLQGLNPHCVRLDRLRTSELGQLVGNAMTIRSWRPSCGPR
jgi:hypothetical protein